MLVQRVRDVQKGLDKIVIRHNITLHNVTIKNTVNPKKFVECAQNYLNMIVVKKFNSLL